MRWSSRTASEKLDQGSSILATWASLSNGCPTVCCLSLEVPSYCPRTRWTCTMPNDLIIMFKVIWTWCQSEGWREKWRDARPPSQSFTAPPHPAQSSHWSLRWQRYGCRSWPQRSRTLSYSCQEAGPTGRSLCKIWLNFYIIKSSMSSLNMNNNKFGKLSMWRRITKIRLKVDFRHPMKRHNFGDTPGQTCNPYLIPCLKHEFGENLWYFTEALICFKICGVLIKLHRFCKICGCWLKHRSFFVSNSTNFEWIFWVESGVMIEKSS